MFLFSTFVFRYISSFAFYKCCHKVEICCLQTVHAICDLGILVAKKLCADEINASEYQTVPLPAQLYVPIQNDETENSVVCDFNIS
jgi:sister-chromatid-cohesion protein PDS5